MALCSGLSARLRLRGPQELGLLELRAVALGCMGRGGKQGKSGFDPEACVAQEASSSAGSQGALDKASAGEVVPASLGEDSWKRGVSLFGHDDCVLCRLIDC